MKQLSFFEPNSPAFTVSKENFPWKLFVDGASRNNPGDAGAGIYLLKENIPFLKEGFYIGTKTNNQAEYLALLLGLYYAQRHMKPEEKILIHSDSELLVKQIHGHYAVKNSELRDLFECVNERLSRMNYAIRHILRKDNSVADKLANHGIDKRLPVPHEFAHLCSFSLIE